MFLTENKKYRLLVYFLIFRMPAFDFKRLLPGGFGIIKNGIGYRHKMKIPAMVAGFESIWGSG